MIHDVYSNFDCANTKASYYFFHIPKTAGTSLNAILESVFAQDEICPPHLWHDLITYDKEKLSKFRFFRGHFYASLNRVVDGPLRGFVFLRDPVERALSHYGHVVRDSGHYLHSRAIKLGSLESYLRDSMTRETVRNFQAKCLVTHFDPVKLAARLSSAELAEFELEKIIETTAIDISDAELLERAKTALDKFCCIGITERFEDSVGLLSNTFGWDLKKSTEALNINRERPRASKISKEELELLEELNSVDIQIYQYALSLFEGRLKQHQRPIGNISNTFISYAQNFEDVMLWRALKHVEHGFYIDIGAWSPDLDSVTRAFYERGWRGINIEPNPEFNRQLQERRPLDRNLRLAVGDREGVLAMNFLGNPGLSTLDDAIAEKHLRAGWSLERQEVQVTTLAAIWQKHVPAGQEVHFLKVDVEGFEEAALRGNDWSRYRPWTVVVEATLPMSQVETHESWEPILFAANYRFAYADGLNRFYVADERPELLPAFKYPPNVFDDFLLSRQQEAEARATRVEVKTQWLQNEWDAAQQRIATLSHQTGALETMLATQREQSAQHKHDLAAAREQVNALEAKTQWLQNEWNAAKAKVSELNHSSHHWWTVAEEFNRELQSVYASKSWRITLPLRQIMLATKWSFTLSVRTVRWALRQPKRMVKPLVVWAMRKALANSSLRAHAINVLNKHPKLKQHIRQLAMHAGLIASWGNALSAGQLSTPNSDSVKKSEPTPVLIMQTGLPSDRFSPRAAHIYGELRTALEERKS